MQICNKIALMVVGLSLTACANLTSISRNTPLSSGNVIDGESIDGKVIHLDAQQRAIIQMGTSYCAEGSPDAIQSIAASQSLGVALTGQGSGSGSNSLASAVASIGLRTQSIQLMRDSLYRLCEAANNERINQSDMAMLLRRSQDLTAVVVAVEQLTGAVKANQALTTGDSQSSASATLISAQQGLQELEDQVVRRKEEVNTAQQAHDGALAAQTAASTELTNAQTAFSADGNDANKIRLANAKSDKESVDRREANAKLTLENKKTLLKDTETIRDEMKAARNVALTAANSSASGKGGFSTPGQAKELSNDASEAIASNVAIMVQRVLNKSYVTDHCMTVLSNNPNMNIDSGFFRMCSDIIQRAAISEFDGVITQFEPDDSTAKIDALLNSGKVTKQQIRDWMTNNGVATSSITTFRKGAKFSQDRKNFLNSVK